MVEGEFDRVEFGLDEVDAALYFRIEIGIFEAAVSAEVSRVVFGRDDRAVVGCT